MNLYAPSYYKKFRCAADKCEHSCCVGWEIDIDNDTLKKYKKLKNDYRDAIIDSISMQHTPHFKLDKGDICPHLDERGLCKIIMHVGEEYLCDICREHPRFYNYTSVAEVGVGMSCAEAAKIILSSADYAVMECVGELDADDDAVDFDGRIEREKIYTILQDTECGYTNKLDRICHAYSIDMCDDSHYLEILNSLEYLDTVHKSLFMNYSSTHRPSGADEYLERFFAYFVYRHGTEAVDLDDFCARLTFCLFCERLFASLICSEHPTSLQEFAALATIISEEIEYSDDNTLSLTY